MITEQEINLAKSICFIISYFITVIFCGCWCICNIISLEKKGKGK